MIPQVVLITTLLIEDTWLDYLYQQQINNNNKNTEYRAWCCSLLSWL